jgi:glyceraldehyde 3-phosphate dehydrogenase
MPRIALNGLGRIGKLVLRDLIDTGAGGDLVLLNDPLGSAEDHALLMEFDSVHGRWPRAMEAGDGSLTIEGQTFRLTAAKRIEDLPWPRWASTSSSTAPASSRPPRRSPPTTPQG